VDVRPNNFVTPFHDNMLSLSLDCAQHLGQKELARSGTLRAVEVHGQVAMETIKRDDKQNLPIEL